MGDTTSSCQREEDYQIEEDPQQHPLELQAFGERRALELRRRRTFSFRIRADQDNIGLIGRQKREAADQKLQAASDRTESLRSAQSSNMPPMPQLEHMPPLSRPASFYKLKSSKSTLKRARKCDVHDCQACSQRFGLLRWQHSCYQCMSVVCSDCSTGTGQLRVCVECRAVSAQIAQEYSADSLSESLAANTEYMRASYTQTHCIRLIVHDGRSALRRTTTLAVPPEATGAELMMLACTAWELPEKDFDSMSLKWALVNRLFITIDPQASLGKIGVKTGDQLHLLDEEHDPFAYPQSLRIAVALEERVLADRVARRSQRKSVQEAKMRLFTFLGSAPSAPSA